MQTGRSATVTEKLRTAIGRSAGLFLPPRPPPADSPCRGGGGQAGGTGAVVWDRLPVQILLPLRSLSPTQVSAAAEPHVVLYIAGSLCACERARIRNSRDHVCKIFAEPTATDRLTDRPTERATELLVTAEKKGENGRHGQVCRYTYVAGMWRLHNCQVFPLWIVDCHVAFCPLQTGARVHCCVFVLFSMIDL